MLPRIVFGLCGFALCLSVIQPSSAVEKEPKVLFIGIDGCRFDALKASDTPRLDSLINAGRVSDHTLILSERYRKSDTSSGPGWSSILTGVWADKHNVQDNSFKAPNYKQYPHFFTLLKRQRPDAVTASIVCWDPIEQYITADADRSFSLQDKGYDLRDNSAAKKAIEVLADPQLDVLFFYLGQVDEMGHATGFHPSNRSYCEAIENVDRHVGQAIDAIATRPTIAKEDWLVVVTSDHGGSGKGHGGGHNKPEILNSFLIVSGDNVATGSFEQQTYIVDAPVTVLAHLGVSPDAAWKLDGESRLVLKKTNADGAHAKPSGASPAK